MTSHRADTTHNISVLPKEIRWRKAIPDVETGVAMILGFLFGIAVLLWCLTGVLDGVAGLAGFATGSWALTAIIYIWMKETDGHR